MRYNKYKRQPMSEAKWLKEHDRKVMLRDIEQARHDVMPKAHARAKRATARFLKNDSIYRDESCKIFSIEHKFTSARTWMRKGKQQTKQTK